MPDEGSAGGTTTQLSTGGAATSSAATTQAPTSAAPETTEAPEDGGSAGSTAAGTTAEGSTTAVGSTTAATVTTTEEPSTGEPDGSDSTSATGGERGGGPTGTVPDENLLGAFVGDMGSGSNPRSVYKLIKEEGADFLIILGDFDYDDSPGTFRKDLESVLGDDFPVFGAIGNHDVKKWSGYQPIFEEWLAKIEGAECSGDLGVDSSCTYRGLHFVLSGVGTIGKKSEREDYIAEALAADDSLWSLCIWHKNQRDMQAGDKDDEVGWTAYKHCQKDGSLIIAGHEHSYARTRTLTDLGNRKNHHGAVGIPELIEVAPGSTFSVVSGLGGKSIRDYEAGLHDDEEWWATLYTGNYHRKNGVKVKNSKADYGALFIRFNVDGDPNTAQGYFKNVEGEVADEFDIVQKKK